MPGLKDFINIDPEGFANYITKRADLLSSEFAWDLDASDTQKGAVGPLKSACLNSYMRLLLQKKLEGFIELADAPTFPVFIINGLNTACAEALKAKMGTEQFEISSYSPHEISVNAEAYRSYMDVYKMTARLEQLVKWELGVRQTKRQSSPGRDGMYAVKGGYQDSSAGAAVSSFTNTLS